MDAEGVRQSGVRMRGRSCPRISGMGAEKIRKHTKGVRVEQVVAELAEGPRREEAGEG